MSDLNKNKVPPEERIPLREKMAYGVGNVAVGVQENADKALLNPIFVLQVGISPATMSLLGLVYRIWDGVTDALMGWISDNTRSRWGRRKPYIVVGAVLMGLVMPLLFFFNPAWEVSRITLWMIGCMLLIYLTNTIFNIPYQCLLLEITPNSTERTNVAVWRGYLGKTVELLIVWMWWIVQLPVFNTQEGKPDIIVGARWATGVLAVFVIFAGLMPAIFVKERFYKQAEKQAKQSLWTNFRLTFTNRPFLFLMGFTLFYSIGLNMKWSLDFYTKLYYVCAGDEKFASALAGTAGTINVVASIAGIPLFQWLARVLGKLRALQITMYVVLTASVMTWFLYTPTYPYLSLLPSILLAPAVSGIWVLIPSLIGDVVDYDELQTNERREGAFASIFSWSLKFALSLSAALSGPLVVLAGFSPELRRNMPEEVVLNMRLLLAFAPVPLIGAAIWLCHRFPLTPDAIATNRRLLEERRGKI